MLSLAPVAAAVPAMALPRPENVKETVGRAGFFMEATAGEHHARIGASVEYPIDVNGLNRDLEAIFKDTAAHYRYLVNEAGRLTAPHNSPVG